MCIGVLDQCIHSSLFALTLLLFVSVMLIKQQNTDLKLFQASLCAFLNPVSLYFTSAVLKLISQTSGTPQNTAWGGKKVFFKVVFMIDRRCHVRVLVHIPNHDISLS